MSIMMVMSTYWHMTPMNSLNPDNHLNLNGKPSIRHQKHLSIYVDSYCSQNPTRLLPFRQKAH